MSTSMNEVVIELYRELQKLNAKRAAKKVSFLKRMFTPSDLKRWVKYFTSDYGFKVFMRRGKNKVKEFNDFTPSDKKFPEARIAVYTVITGGYDALKDPVYIDDELDYYAVMDCQASQKESSIWKTLQLPPVPDGLNNVKKQRYIKLHPDEVMKLTGKDYDYMLYIDGSLRITCDIKPLVYSMIEAGKTIASHTHSRYASPFEDAPPCYFYKGVERKELIRQMNFYEREGLKNCRDYFETPVMIYKTGDYELKTVLETWWEQILHFTHRDQLSLPYALVKNGKDGKYIFSLGNSVFRSPYFLYYGHD